MEPERVVRKLKPQRKDGNKQMLMVRQVSELDGQELGGQGGEARSQQRKAGGCGKSSCSHSGHTLTHGYLGYPGSGAGEGGAGSLVLAPPCRG